MEDLVFHPLVARIPSTFQSNEEGEAYREITGRVFQARSLVDGFEQMLQQIKPEGALHIEQILNSITAERPELEFLAMIDPDTGVFNFIHLNHALRDLSNPDGFITTNASYPDDKHQRLGESGLTIQQGSGRPIIQMVINLNSPLLRVSRNENEPLSVAEAIEVGEMLVDAGKLIFKFAGQGELVSRNELAK